MGFATAVFRNQVVVTALSQPVIAAGRPTKVGDLQVAETAIGQLKDGRASASRSFRGPRTRWSRTPSFNALNTANLPTVTASGGLVVSPVNCST